MFERPRHREIALVLAALDADLLREHQCFFGGGTAIALRHGEYRESEDLDFLVSDLEAYRALRRLVGSQGVSALFRRPEALQGFGNVRADQYGIRTLLSAGNSAIKFEIVFEARIDLARPRERDSILGVSTLAEVDLAASKLLANSDRWADDGVFSRDVIDLAMLELKPRTWQAAIEKAEAAYGDSIRRDLARAVEAMAQRKGWLDRCMEKLSVSVPKALLWQRIKRLRARTGGPQRGLTPESH